ncbi:MAG: hypothetical protein LBF88_07960 [Planctomycetaceae bacterium]|nr:hypothetical protein [Planctomycetaceae bacterium]
MRIPREKSDDYADFKKIRSNHFVYVDKTGELEEGNIDFLHENLFIEFKHDEEMAAQEENRANIPAARKDNFIRRHRLHKS